MIFHVLEVEKFNWRDLDISCPRIEKGELESFRIFHVHKFKKFNRRALGYFMSTNRKSLTGEL